MVFGSFSLWPVDPVVFVPVARQHITLRRDGGTKGLISRSWNQEEEKKGAEVPQSPSRARSQWPKHLHQVPSPNGSTATKWWLHGDQVSNT